MGVPTTASFHRHQPGRRERRGVSRDAGALNVATPGGFLRLRTTIENQLENRRSPSSFTMAIRANGAWHAAGKYFGFGTRTDWMYVPGRERPDKRSASRDFRRTPSITAHQGRRATGMEVFSPRRACANSVGFGLDPKDQGALVHRTKRPLTSLGDGSSRPTKLDHAPKRKCSRASRTATPVLIAPDRVPALAADGRSAVRTRARLREGIHNGAEVGLGGRPSPRSDEVLHGQDVPRAVIGGFKSSFAEATGSWDPQKPIGLSRRSSARPRRKQGEKSASDLAEGWYQPEKRQNSGVGRRRTLGLRCAGNGGALLVSGRQGRSESTGSPDDKAVDCFKSVVFATTPTRRSRERGRRVADA